MYSNAASLQSCAETTETALWSMWCLIGIILSDKFVKFWVQLWSIWSYCTVQGGGRGGVVNGGRKYCTDHDLWHCIYYCIRKLELFRSGNKWILSSKFYH